MASALERLNSRGEPEENLDPKVICVLGAGSFGTAMAFAAAKRGNKVRIYARNQDQVDKINMDRVNPRYLSEFEFPENITAFTSPYEALEGCDIILHALPAQVQSARFVWKNKSV